MTQFRRSRLKIKADEEITKKTLFLGLLTIVVFTLMVIFGLPFLIKFSIMLGEARSKKDSQVTEKVLPPMAPRLILPFEATNSGQISVTGLAEKNITVELLKNETSIGKTVTNDAGEFSFNDIQLEQGDSRFSAIAISDISGSSESSKEITVTYDNIAPSLAMTNPSENSLSVDSADFDIIGQSEKGVSVTVNGQIAMVDDLGKFKLKLQLNTGKNNVEIVVRDLAGNETKKTITINYDI